MNTSKRPQAAMVKLELLSKVRWVERQVGKLCLIIPESEMSHQLISLPEQDEMTPSQIREFDHQLIFTPNDHMNA